MAQRRQTRAARAAALAAESPRPRRRAAARAAASTTDAHRGGTAWTIATGTALVGKLIDVWWQPDETFYRALALSYNPRKHQHKLIYLADESVEMVELGDGQEQRAWQRVGDVTDALVGKDLVFLRDEDDDEDEPAWFDFMRGPREKKSQEFEVKVYAKLTSEPDPEEVCSPLQDDDENAAHLYYRVIHLANEYIATVDLAAITYRVVEEGKGEEDEEGTIDLVSPPRPLSALPEDSRRGGIKSAEREEPGAAEVGGGDDDDDDKDDAYVPPAEDGDASDEEPMDEPEEERRGRKRVAVDDADVDAEPARKVRARAEEGETKPRVKVESHAKGRGIVKADPSAEKKPDVDADSGAERDNGAFEAPGPEADGDDEMTEEPMPGMAVGVTDADIKDSGRSGKTVTVDRVTDVDKDPTAVIPEDKPATAVQVDPDDSMNVSSLDDEARAQTETKVKGEGSVGTQDTHDEPLDRSGSTKEKANSRGPISVPKTVLPGKYEDEEANTQHTASDEEKLGWVSGDRKRAMSLTKSQVGDHISVDTGDGKFRKAFVEAYLPANDKHFVAFCDAQGGNMQIRLTKTNHTLLTDDEIQELNRRQITVDEPPPTSNGQRGRPRGKRRRNLTDGRSKKRRETKLEVKGESAGPELCGRCLKIVWPGSDLVYTALVLGFNSKTKEHMVVYLSDHCVETLELKYREWNLLAKEDEPWIEQGMVGKRLYVFWTGEYDDPKAQAQAVKMFGDETRVPYEAYVLSYEGDRKYKILYPATEDTETRELTVEEDDDMEPIDKEWDILEQGQEEVNGLPVLAWSE